jgi:PAS domain S-box-containing protein
MTVELDPGLCRVVWESTLAGAGDAILAVDDRRQIVVYNECAARVFGWACAEAVGQSVDLLIPDLEETGACDVPSTALGVLAKRKTGEEFPIDATLSEFEVAGVRMCAIVLRDCSLQKRADREQRLLAELGAALCAAKELGDVLTRVAELSVRFLADCCTIHWLDEENELHTRVVHADPSKSTIADALERVPLDPKQQHLCTPAMAERHPFPLLEMTAERLETLEQNEEYRSLMRELEPVVCVGLPLVSRDRRLGAIVLISCSAERSFGPDDVMLGQQLAFVASDAIERALVHRALLHDVEVHKAVLGIVAHDLRSPITVARWAIQGLTRQQSPERRVASRKTFELVLRALDRLSRLVEDLLIVSQVDAGHMALYRVAVAPEEIVGEIVNSFAAAASAASLCIDTELAEPLPPVLADNDRIHQVFSNLIGNAIKFTPPGGRIALGAERFESGVRFWVRDTGRGIPPEDVPRVFDRFWQSSSARQRGVGLGLSIARGIVAAHGGHISVHSSPGNGTTFYFTLPAATDQQCTTAERQRAAC